MISLGISSLAWPADATHDTLRMLAMVGFDAVEVAPASLLGEAWTMPRGLEVAESLRDLLEHRGLKCNALQGILFGVHDVELFKDQYSRDNLRRHLIHVAELAKVLGAKVCVFGAPKQRQIGKLSLGEAHIIAASFFRTIAPEFAGRGLTLAFEANPKHYGCDFITNTGEAADLAGDVGQAGFGVQLDTGTMIMSMETPGMLFKGMEYAAHLHISQPELAPVGGGQWLGCHEAIASALHDLGYFGKIPGAGEFDCERQPGSVTVEMKPALDWWGAIRVAADFARSVYLTPPG